jgi:hypothetical protein
MAEIDLWRRDVCPETAGTLEVGLFVVGSEGTVNVIYG